MHKYGSCRYGTYHCLHHICKVVRQCDDESSLFRVGGTDFVGPTENKWTGARLDLGVSKPIVLGGAMMAYSGLAEPIDGHATLEVAVKWHLAQ